MISEDLSIIRGTLFLLPFFFLTSADCDYGPLYSLLSPKLKKKNQVKGAGNN